ncbi:MAG: DUF2905 domain-containing protein [Chloroflexota bacterium]
MTFDQLGKLLIMLGIIIVLLGGLFLLFGRSFLGKLPGDINVSNGNFTCIVPIASMIVLSLLLTIVVNIVLRILNR